MKARRIIKGIISLTTITIELVSLGLLSYGILLYKGIETFYRIYAIIILLYIALFLAYLIIKNIQKKSSTKLIILIIVSLLFTGIQCAGYYYLTKVYQTINSYSKTENTYSSALVTYNLKLNDYKDLKKVIIGVVDDKKDIEGSVLPKEIITELKLSNNNTIKEYTSAIELMVALKNKDIEAGFFSRNYIDMFYSLEEYENIEEETKILYEKSKEYEVVEDTHDTTNSSFKDAFTILFIGVDSSKDGVTSGYNADVLILVTFNPKTLQATMTSVPRDMYMKTACSGSSYRRINTTTWGSSSSCAVNTIEKLFDVDIDYYAKINFKGVVQLVDSVGGIDVDVPYSFCEQNSSRSWGDSTLFIEKGKQHLNGEQALAFARNRHKPNDGSGAGKKMAEFCPTWTEGSRSDYTRGKNQLKVIMGVVKAATKLTDVNQAIEILETISKNFQTNIKTDDVMQLYSLGKAIAFTDGASNLINVQRMQLKGYSASIWDVNSKSYPSVTIPYNGSINDIKEQIQINLGKKQMKTINNVSFDLNDLFQDSLLGQGSYSQSKIATLANVSNYSVDSLKSYANSNGLTLKFIDVDTGSEVSLSSYGTYKFSSQKEHKDTILSLIDTLTIYVKKQSTPTTPVVEETTNPSGNTSSTLEASSTPETSSSISE